MPSYTYVFHRQRFPGGCACLGAIGPRSVTPPGTFVHDSTVPSRVAHTWSERKVDGKQHCIEVSGETPRRVVTRVTSDRGWLTLQGVAGAHEVTGRDTRTDLTGGHDMFPILTLIQLLLTHALFYLPHSPRTSHHTLPPLARLSLCLLSFFAVFRLSIHDRFISLLFS